MAAYRRSLELAPGLGESWWSLANLKTRRFEDEEVRGMVRALRDAKGEDAFHLHYALGKALEDAQDWDASFRQYAEGAQAAEARVCHTTPTRPPPASIGRLALLDAPIFGDAARGRGRAPIFIVGLPRSGSTLLEQILASHSQVEGTIELPDIGRIARELAPKGDYRDAPCRASRPRGATRARRRLPRTHPGPPPARPTAVHRQDAEQLAAHPPDPPILPVPRSSTRGAHPMAAGFSCFKQHFARGQAFSYDLDDIGRYYRDYLRLMRGAGRRWPGRVHLAIYEDVVADTEEAVRRLLDHCGLPSKTRA